jgi:hypothetical protein
MLKNKQKNFEVLVLTNVVHVNDLGLTFHANV